LEGDLAYKHLDVAVPINIHMGDSIQKTKSSGGTW